MKRLLALDETGKASYRHASLQFALSGVVIPESFKGKLESTLKKLKGKYFGDEDITLHGRDILNRSAKFIALQDNIENKTFWSDLISVLNNEKIDVIFCIADKTKARKAGWLKKTILTKEYICVVNSFALEHLSDGRDRGNIIVESDFQQDPFVIKAHGHMQGSGTSDGSVSGKDYSKRCASVSFVWKANKDADVEVADILAHLAVFKYRYDKARTKPKLSVVERMRLKFIGRKLKQTGSSYHILI